MRLLEFLNELMVLMVGISMMVLLVTAFTRVKVFHLEWELRTNWKNRLSLDFHLERDRRPHLIPVPIKSYHPKVPSRTDHANQDDEDPIVVFRFI